MDGCPSGRPGRRFGPRENDLGSAGVGDCEDKVPRSRRCLVGQGTLRFGDNRLFFYSVFPDAAEAAAASRTEVGVGREVFAEPGSVGWHGRARTNSCAHHDHQDLGASAPGLQGLKEVFLRWAGM